MDYSKESVNGIIFNEDRTAILLIKRRDVPVWVLPGGGIEKGELPKEAALREVEEETGVKVSFVRKIGEYSPLCRLARYTHVFEFQIHSGSLKITEETAGICFFNLSALPKKIPPPYPDWIKDGVSNVPTLIQKKITSVTYWNLFKNLIFHPILVLRFILSRIGFTINKSL